jgi:hypothetical protein
VDTLYPSFGRFSGFYLLREDGSDILSPDAFNAALKLHQGTQAVMWANSKGGKKVVEWRNTPTSYTDLCLGMDGQPGASSPDGCASSTVLSLFGFSPTNWDNKEKILAVINDRSKWNTNMTGEGFVLDSALGSISRGTDGKIVSAKALAHTYLLTGNLTLDNAQKIDEAAFGWEKEWLDYLKVWALGLKDPTCAVSYVP